MDPGTRIEEKIMEPQQQQQQEKPQLAGRVRPELSNYMTGELPAVAGSCTKSGAISSSTVSSPLNNQGSALSSILRNGGMQAATALETSSRVSYDLSREMALSMPGGMARMLSPEPTHEAQAEALAERHHWKVAREAEMDGLIKNNAWKQVPRPEIKKVVRKKNIYKRKTKSIGKIERHKSRLVFFGYQRTEGLHFDEKMSSTPTASSIGMVMETPAVRNCELRHVGVVQALTRALIDKEFYIEIREDN